MLPGATLSRIICPSACALLLLVPAATRAQTSPDLSGKWALNRALSQFPSELGFDANFRSMAVDEQETAERGGRGRRPPSRMPLPESADEGARKEQLTDEVRDPAANLTITDTPDAVTFADDRGHSRTFHPNGKEELIQLGGVGVVTIARREAGQLLVLYEVSQGRQIRYTFSRQDDPARLIVETSFIDCGNADTVTRLYEPAKAAAPSAPGAQTSSSGSPAPPQERRRPRPRCPARAPSSGGSRRSASSSKS